MTVLAAIDSAAYGQSASSDYEVYVPPFMSLTQLQPDRSANHPQTSADVALGSSLWLARTANPAGVTVNLRADQPFQNLNNPGAQRDIRLRMPFVIGFGWTIDTAIDQSDYAIGKPGAAVEASSTNAGFAWLPLQVTFITGDVNTLDGGTYQATVIGTITGN